MDTELKNAMIEFLKENLKIELSIHETRFGDCKDVSLTATVSLDGEEISSSSESLYI